MKLTYTEASVHPFEGDVDGRSPPEPPCASAPGWAQIVQAIKVAYSEDSTHSSEGEADEVSPPRPPWSAQVLQGGYISSDQ